MTLIIDGLLVAAATFAGTYCFVLARRVRALKDLDSGIGGAITRMTQALDEARRALEEAKAAGREEHRDLRQLVSRAEVASAQLRVLLAATRNLPEPDKRLERQPESRQAPEPRPRAAGGEAEGNARAEQAQASSFWGQEEAPRTAAGGRPVDHSGGSQRERVPANDAVPKPAPLQPAPALLRQRVAAAPVAAPTDEADLLAALADFAHAGRN